MPLVKFFGSSKRVLGIDIGSFAIRMVELSGREGGASLENYASLESSFLYSKPFRSLKENTLTLSTKEIAEALSEMIDEAKIRAKTSSFSMPDFSSFFTTFTLPSMSKEELQEAVKFEARKYVPLPIQEIALDWSPVGGLKEKGHDQVRILLAAVPKRVIEQYQEIAYLAGLELKSVEAEVFSIARALVELSSEETIAIVDIGAKSTTCTIVDLGTVKISHSFAASGEELTLALEKELDLNLEEAERLKRRYGLLDEAGAVREVLLPVVDSIIMEIDKTFQQFYQLEQRTIKRVILAGATALMPGLKDYLSSKLGKSVEIAYAFKKVYVPPKIESVLRSLGPEFCSAVGVALSQILIE